MWAYVKANRVRFALLSVAGVGVATAAVYGRRYYGAIQQVWAAEREAGARALRGKYVANSYVTEAAAAALLPLIRNKIPTPKALVAALRSGSVKKADKVKTWEQVRDTTLVMLASTAAATASVYVALVLATNLCREDGLNEHIRDKIINAAIEDSVACLQERALVTGKSLPLKKKVGRDDLRNIAEQMLNDERLKLFDENWIFADQSDATVEVKDRLNECMDLANTLEYRSAVLDATHHVLDCMVDNVRPEQWNKPCAQLLSSIQQVANQSLTQLPESLRILPSVEHLGVAVFLSTGSTSPAPTSSFF